MPVSSKEFLDIPPTAECRFTLNSHVAWKKKQGQCTVEISSHNIAQLFGQTGEMAECSLEK